MTGPEDLHTRMQRNMMAMTQEQMRARDLRQSREMQNSAQSYPAESLRNFWPHDASPPEPEAPKSLLARLASWWRK